VPLVQFLVVGVAGAVLLDGVEDGALEFRLVAFDDAAGVARLAEVGLQAIRPGGTTVLVGVPGPDESTTLELVGGFLTAGKKLVGCLLGAVTRFGTSRGSLRCGGRPSWTSMPSLPAGVRSRRSMKRSPTLRRA
jgi:hypothetical protein